MRFMENNILLDNIKHGDRNSILVGLKHKGAIYRINALINIVRHSIDDSAEINEELYKLLEDDISIDGYTVSDFAYAVLDLTGIESYSGNDKHIKDLIDSRLVF